MKSYKNHIESYENQIKSYEKQKESDDDHIESYENKIKSYENHIKSYENHMKSDEKTKETCYPEETGHMKNSGVPSNRKKRDIGKIRARRGIPERLVIRKKKAGHVNKIWFAKKCRKKQVMWKKHNI